MTDPIAAAAVTFGYDVTMRLKMLRQDHANGRELGDLACAWADMFQELARKLCTEELITITRREYDQLRANQYNWHQQLTSMQQRITGQIR